MQNILVPIDFSDAVPALLEQAALLARMFYAQVRLLHVVAPEPAFVGLEAGPEAVRDQLAAAYRQEHRDLQRLAASLSERGLSVSALLVQGPAAETILEQAARWHADLIVIGTHGRGALSRALLGSVSQTVIRRASCPVLVVPAHLTTGVEKS